MNFRRAEFSFAVCTSLMRNGPTPTLRSLSSLRPPLFGFLKDGKAIQVKVLTCFDSRVRNSRRIPHLWCDGNGQVPRQTRLLALDKSPLLGRVE